MGADAGAAEASAPDGHATGTFCAGRTSVFCEDFDTPAFTSRSWTYTETTMSGAGLPLGALDGATVVSAPSAFTARTPAISGTAGARQQLAGPDALHVDADLGFAVRIGVEIARVEGTNPITFAGFGVALLATASGASLELVQGPITLTEPLQTAPRIGAWPRVALTPRSGAYGHGAADVAGRPDRRRTSGDVLARARHGGPAGSGPSFGSGSSCSDRRRPAR